jgi:hypothetical protein
MAIKIIIIIIFSITVIDILCTVIVPKERIIPYCKNCKYFIQNGDKCSRFKHIDVITGDVISETHSAKYAREKTFMCTIEGKYFDPTEASIIEAAQIMRYIQNKDFTSLEIILQLYSIYNNLHGVFSTNLH